MRTKSKARKYIEHEWFYVARRRAGLTMMQVAELLEVDIRTVRNWENGSCKIPYAAFRLMRMAGGYSLLGKAWEGWALWQGKLFTPAGRSFEPHELQYVGNYIAMARLFLKSRENINPDVYASERANARNDALTSKPSNAKIVSGDASGATAPTGASHRHEAILITVDFSQQQAKPERRKSQGELMFGRFSGYRESQRMRLIMARVHRKLVKEASSMPYFALLFCPKAGPRAPGRMVKSDLGNCQPFSLSRYACITLPSFARTLKRLDVIPKRFAALLAEMKTIFSYAGNDKNIMLLL